MSVEQTQIDRVKLQVHIYSLAYIKLFLLSRKFFVSVDNSFSEPEILNCGVSQGFILGLLLFLIYTNDLTQLLSESYSYLCVDDTCIYAKTNIFTKLQML